MHLLLICDDLWHPAEVLARGLVFLEEHGHTLDIICDAKDILTPEMLRSYDAVILAKGNTHSPANPHAVWFEPGITLTDPAEFRRFVEEGGALLVLHAGTVFDEKQCPEMTDLIGSCFVTHPAQCRVDISVADHEHPVTKGIEDFSLIRDEHYQMKMLCDDYNLLLNASSQHGTQPAGYTRETGKGRICVFTPGHNAWVLSHPSYAQLIENGLAWVTKQI